MSQQIKKLISFIVFVLFISSVFADRRLLGEQVKKSEKAWTTTINKQQVDREDEARIKKARIAYGAIEFGDSESIVKRKAKKDSSIRIASEGKDYTIYRVSIGATGYLFEPSYYEGKLYSIDISGCWRRNTANYYNTEIKEDWQNLVDVISMQYDNSHRVMTNLYNGLYPSLLEMHSGYIKWTHIWRYETKQIMIGVSEGSGDDENIYCPLLRISHIPVEEKIKDEKRMREQKTKRESSEKF